MPRNSQVSRILRILHYLELNPNGLRAREILSKVHADGFKCSRETVYRDLQAIEAALIPITNEGSGEDAVWKLATLVRLNRDIYFSFNEMLAAYISRGSLESLKGSPLYDSIDSFFLKLGQLLGVRGQESLAVLSQYIHVSSNVTWLANVTPETFKTVEMACAEGHVLEFDYRASSGVNAGNSVRRKVGPDALVIRDSGAYLIGRDLIKDETRFFVLARMSAVDMTDEHYESESGLDPEQYFKQSFGMLSNGQLEKVELHVKEPMAAYLSERRFHESQQVRRVNECVVMNFELNINDEFARWVLSLGPSCEVRRPERLRELVRAMALEISRNNAKRSA